MLTAFLPPPGLPTELSTVAELFAALSVQAGEPETVAWTLYDTPDRRLWAADLVLSRHGRHLALYRRHHLGTGEAVAEQAWRAIELPRLLAQWPGGLLKEALLPVVQVRALLPLLTCRVERHPGVRLDDQGKIVVRLEARIAALASEERRLWLVVEGLRGYDPQQQEAMQALRDRGWQQAGEEPMARLAGEAVGEPKQALQLISDGDQPAGPGLRAFLGRALHRLGELEQGVVEDIDSEFLHQHRVLLRRVRALSTPMRSVFAEPDAQRIKALLAAWAHASNPLRDLDVWLLAREDHASLVPEGLRPGLAAFFAGIARDRATAQRELAQRLASPAHHHERDEFARLLASPDQGPDAEERLAQLTLRQTWKAYRRMAVAASVVEASTSVGEVHQVRLRCKKLRYLLDACVSFSAPEDHRRLHDQLKAVQAVLGSFNDTAMQSAALLSRVQATGPEAATQLAVGALLGALDRQHEALRHRMLLGLAELVSPNTRNRYRRLFRPQDE